MRDLLPVAGMLCILFSDVCHADIYQCEGADGEPSFSQSPCGSFTRLIPAQDDRPRRAAVGIRDSERAWLESRNQVDRRPAKRKASTTSGNAAARKRKAAHACRSKRQSLAAVRAELRRGYKPARGEKLRRRRASYEDYLATFCR
jgi:hypothetical protein